MISLDEKIWGLSILSWILIIIILVFFIYKVFYTNKSASNNDDETETFKETNAPLDDDTVKVYNFNTSWCGWSVKFQPEWNKFSDEVKKNSELDNVKAFDIKCDKPENEAVCKEFDVQGFPTVIIESGGRRGVYKGPRESKDLIETVKDL